MDFKSQFGIGDKVFVPINGRPTLVTIGRITIEYTDSKGRVEEEVFDNFKPQKGYKEMYMCDETGVGTGLCWEAGKNIFATEKECKDAITPKLSDEYLQRG